MIKDHTTTRLPLSPIGTISTAAVVKVGRRTIPIGLERVDGVQAAPSMLSFNLSCPILTPTCEAGVSSVSMHKNCALWYCKMEYHPGAPVPTPTVWIYFLDVNTVSPQHGTVQLLLRLPTLSGRSVVHRQTLYRHMFSQHDHSPSVGRPSNAVLIWILVRKMYMFLSIFFKC